jgi:hypothetical protein
MRIAATAIVLGAVLFASSPVQAEPLSAPSVLKTAIHYANGTQKAFYVCPRGSYGRRCHYVSRADQQLRYDRPYANRAYQLRPYESRYFHFYYANPQGSD